MQIIDIDVVATAKDVQLVVVAGSGMTPASRGRLARSVGDLATDDRSSGVLNEVCQVEDKEVVDIKVVLVAAAKGGDLGVADGGGCMEAFRLIVVYCCDGGLEPAVVLQVKGPKVLEVSLGFSAGHDHEILNKS